MRDITPARSVRSSDDGVGWIEQYFCFELEALVSRWDKVSGIQPYLGYSQNWTLEAPENLKCQRDVSHILIQLAL